MPTAGATPATSTFAGNLLMIAQLCHVIRQCCQDQTTYQQQVGHIWVVAMQHYTHVDFNIGKQKNITKEEKKQGSRVRSMLRVAKSSLDAAVKQCGSEAVSL
jgi:hypothetical protein